MSSEGHVMVGEGHVDHVMVSLDQVKSANLNGSCLPRLAAVSGVLGIGGIGTARTVGSIRSWLTIQFIPLGPGTVLTRSTVSSRVAVSAGKTLTSLTSISSLVLEAKANNAIHVEFEPIEEGEDGKGEETREVSEET